MFFVLDFSKSVIFVGFRLIGMYGDADPLDKDQWLQLSISFPTDTRQWNDKTSTCTNVFSGRFYSLL